MCDYIFASRVNMIKTKLTNGSELQKGGCA